MENQVQFESNIHLLIDTELSQEEVNVKFHKDNIVNAEVSLTLSDGSVHKVSFADILSLRKVSPEENEDIEKATHQIGIVAK